MALLGVVGDLHGGLVRLEAVLRAFAGHRVGGVLLVGDLASPRWEREERWLPDALPRLRREVAVLLDVVGRLGVPVAWVPGNHDLRQLDGPGCCDRRTVRVAGHTVFGIGGAGPGRFGFPYEWGEEEVAGLAPPAGCEVILSHTPPARTRLDLARGGRHVGSESVRDLALGHRGVLVCGHIHEAAGVERLGDCLCLNAGALGEPYPAPQLGLVRSDGGVWSVEHHQLETGRVERLAVE